MSPGRVLTERTHSLPRTGNRRQLTANPEFEFGENRDHPAWDFEIGLTQTRPRLHPKTSGARELGLEHRASRVDRSRHWTNTIGQSRIRRDKNAPRFTDRAPTMKEAARGSLPVVVPNLTSIRDINLNRRILLLPTSEPIACTLPDIVLLGMHRMATVKNYAGSSTVSSKPAGAEFWHLWTVIIPRRSITGRLVRGRVWRRHDGRRWQYKRFVEYNWDRE